MKEPLKQAIIDGNADTALALTQALLASGADGYGANAGMAVERAKELVG